MEKLRLRKAGNGSSPSDEWNDFTKTRSLVPNEIALRAKWLSKGQNRSFASAYAEALASLRSGSTQQLKVTEMSEQERKDHTRHDGGKPWEQRRGDPRAIRRQRRRQRQASKKQARLLQGEGGKAPAAAPTARKQARRDRMRDRRVRKTRDLRAAQAMLPEREFDANRASAAHLM